MHSLPEAKDGTRRTGREEKKQMPLTETTTVEHVRLKRSRAGPTVAKLRLAHLLAPLSLQPPAMPPSSILIVRSMADPLPGRITRGFGPAARAATEWERAAQKSLDSLFASAQSPLLGPVPASAVAVRFADFSELLACLACELGSGATLGWWWRSILRQYPLRLPGSWAAVWAEHPLYVPAALEYLDAQGEAVRVLERIAPTQAFNLLAIVLREFGLTELLPTAAARSVNPGKLSGARASILPFAAPESATGQDTTPGDESIAGPLWAVADRPFPWEPYRLHASMPAQLGWERQALLGIALLLRHAPAAASRPAFIRRFHAWVEAARAKPSKEETAERSQEFPSTDQASARIIQNPAPQESHRNALLPSDPWPAQSIHAPPASAPKIEAAEAQSPASAKTDLRAQHEIAAEAVAGNKDPSPKRWEDGIATEAGGVLYLIHLLRRADLMRHFDTGLSGWALLELLARCLFSDACLAQNRELWSDPIWRALANLDGREPGVPAGLNFEPQAVYEAPQAWLEHRAPDSPDSERVEYVRFRARGFELWSPEGFLLLDAQRPFPARGVIHRMPPAFRREVRSAASIRPTGLVLSRELRRFLHFLLPYARWRMRRAFGSFAWQPLLLRRGHLYLSRTHVDLVMPMSQISVPIRLAGLDANPGWAPELGRVITFHFELEAR
jgi:hypothetical protein